MESEHDIGLLGMEDEFSFDNNAPGAQQNPNFAFQQSYQTQFPNSNPNSNPASAYASIDMTSPALHNFSAAFHDSNGFSDSHMNDQIEGQSTGHLTDSEAGVINSTTPQHQQWAGKREPYTPFLPEANSNLNYRFNGTQSMMMPAQQSNKRTQQQQHQPQPQSQQQLHQLQAQIMQQQQQLQQLQQLQVQPGLLPFAFQQPVAMPTLMDGVRNPFQQQQQPQQQSFQPHQQVLQMPNVQMNGAGKMNGYPVQQQQAQQIHPNGFHHSAHTNRPDSPILDAEAPPPDASLSALSPNQSWKVTLQLRTGERNLLQRHVLTPLQISITDLLFQATNVHTFSSVTVEGELIEGGDKCGHLLLTSIPAIQKASEFVKQEPQANGKPNDVPSLNVSIVMDLGVNIKACTRLGCPNLLLKQASRRACNHCQTNGCDLRLTQLRKIYFDAPKLTPAGKQFIDDQVRAAQASGGAADPNLASQLTAQLLKQNNVSGSLLSILDQALGRSDHWKFEVPDEPVMIIAFASDEVANTVQRRFEQLTYDELHAPPSITRGRNRNSRRNASDKANLDRIVSPLNSNDSMPQLDSDDGNARPRTRSAGRKENKLNMLPINGPIQGTHSSSRTPENHSRSTSQSAGRAHVDGLVDTDDSVGASGAATTHEMANSVGMHPSSIDAPSSPDAGNYHPEPINRVASSNTISTPQTNGTAPVLCSHLMPVSSAFTYCVRMKSHFWKLEMRGTEPIAGGKHLCYFYKKIGKPNQSRSHGNGDKKMADDDDDSEIMKPGKSVAASVAAALSSARGKRRHAQVDEATIIPASIGMQPPTLMAPTTAPVSAASSTASHTSSPTAGVAHLSNPSSVGGSTPRLEAASKASNSAASTPSLPQQQPPPGAQFGPMTLPNAIVRPTLFSHIDGANPYMHLDQKAHDHSHQRSHANGSSPENGIASATVSPTPAATEASSSVASPRSNHSPTNNMVVGIGSVPAPTRTISLHNSLRPHAVHHSSQVMVTKEDFAKMKHRAVPATMQISSTTTTYDPTSLDTASPVTNTSVRSTGVLLIYRDRSTLARDMASGYLGDAPSSEDDDDQGGDGSHPGRRGGNGSNGRSNGDESKDGRGDSDSNKRRKVDTQKFNGGPHGSQYNSSLPVVIPLEKPISIAPPSDSRQSSSSGNSGSQSFSPNSFLPRTPMMDAAAPGGVAELHHASSRPGSLLFAHEEKYSSADEKQGELSSSSLGRHSDTGSLTKQQQESQRRALQSAHQNRGSGDEEARTKADQAIDDDYALSLRIHQEELSERDEPKGSMKFPRRNDEDEFKEAGFDKEKQLRKHNLLRKDPGSFEKSCATPLFRILFAFGYGPVIAVTLLFMIGILGAFFLGANIVGGGGLKPNSKTDTFSSIYLFATESDVEHSASLDNDRKALVAALVDKMQQSNSVFSLWSQQVETPITMGQNGEITHITPNPTAAAQTSNVTAVPNYCMDSVNAARAMGGWLLYTSGLKAFAQPLGTVDPNTLPSTPAAFCSRLDSEVGRALLYRSICTTMTQSTKVRPYCLTNGDTDQFGPEGCQGIVHFLESNNYTAQAFGWPSATDYTATTVVNQLARSYYSQADVLLPQCTYFASEVQLHALSSDTATKNILMNNSTFAILLLSSVGMVAIFLMLVLCILWVFMRKLKLNEFMDASNRAALLSPEAVNDSSLPVVASNTVPSADKKQQLVEIAQILTLPSNDEIARSGAVTVHPGRTIAALERAEDQPHYAQVPMSEIEMA